MKFRYTNKNLKIEDVVYKNNYYQRKSWDNDQVIQWLIQSKDGNWDSYYEEDLMFDKLEKLYQKLINKPSETTNELPTMEQVNQWIKIYKPDFCPCMLGKPFYPEDNCECGG